LPTQGTPKVMSDTATAYYFTRTTTFTTNQQGS
jgi:hypothetical protein